MNPDAKKVSIIIIFILVLTISGLWYNKNKNADNSNGVVTEKGERGIDPSHIKYLLSDKELEGITNVYLSANQSSEQENSTSTVKLYRDEYQKGNLKITSVENKDSLISYGKQTALALKSLGTYGTEGTKLVLAAVKNEDPQATEKLLALANNYRESEEKLLTVTVPASAISIDLKILNNLNRIGKTLTDMSKVTSNPESALVSASLYQQNLVVLYQSFNELNNYFKIKGINFSEKDQTVI